MIGVEEKTWRVVGLDEERTEGLHERLLVSLADAISPPLSLLIYNQTIDEIEIVIGDVFQVMQKPLYLDFRIPLRTHRDGLSPALRGFFHPHWANVIQHAFPYRTNTSNYRPNPLHESQKKIHRKIVVIQSIPIACKLFVDKD